MSDFHQNGVVTVLHRLGSSNLDRLEKELERHASNNPIALILPSLYSELENPALKNIVHVLKNIRYVNEIVVSLDRASALEFRLAKQFFSVYRNVSASCGMTAPAFRIFLNCSRPAKSIRGYREKAEAAGWRSDTCWRADRAM